MEGQPTLQSEATRVGVGGYCWGEGQQPHKVECFSLPIFTTLQASTPTSQHRFEAFYLKIKIPAISYVIHTRVPLAIHWKQNAPKLHYIYSDATQL